MSDLIPREFIQQLLTRIDIIELIDARIPLRKKTGNNFFACCPFHQEKTPSFSASQNKQFYYCFGCGAHGNAIDFLMEYDRLSFVEAVQQLASSAGLEIPHQTSYQQSQKENLEPLYAISTQATKYFESELRQSERAITYLKNRGVSGKIAQFFQIGYAPSGWDHLIKHFKEENKQNLLNAGLIIQKDEGGGYYDRFRDRILFPIQDRKGRVIGFGGRIIDQGEPKYLNSPETAIFQKGHELYGLYQVLKLNRNINRILIVEGYMDVIALFQHEITYCVATLGTATTPHHIQRLHRYTSEIIFCFDGDSAGRTAAWRALMVIFPIMRDDLTVKFMFLPDGEDPDSLIRKEGKSTFEARMQNALTLSDFFFQTQSAQADIQHPDGRARFVKLAMDHLQQLPDGIFKTIMIEELAKKVRIPINSISPIKSHSQTSSTTSSIKDGQIKSTYASKRTPPKSANSPVRQALILILQNPQLAHYITKPLPEINLPGYDLLKEIIGLIKQQPELNTTAAIAAILEHYRDHKDRQALSKLANLNPLTPESGYKNEFLGVLQKLEKMAKKQQITQLLERHSMLGLNENEKFELKRLIEEKN